MLVEFGLLLVLLALLVVREPYRCPFLCLEFIYRCSSAAVDAGTLPYNYSVALSIAMHLAAAPLGATTAPS